MPAASKMSTRIGAASLQDWSASLKHPTSKHAALYIKELHASGQVQELIAAPPLPNGSTLMQFYSSFYEALCANPDLPDSIAIPALESFHDVHKPQLLQPLHPEKRALDTIPAVLSLQRPAWLKLLLSSKGLKAGARYKPSGGALRRLQNTTLLHAVVLAVALSSDQQQRKALERSFTQLLLAGADPCALDSCGLVALEWMVQDGLRGQVSSRAAKHLSPTVVRQLWLDNCYTEGSWPESLCCVDVDKILPLLQLPLQELISSRVLRRTQQQGYAAVNSGSYWVPVYAAIARVSTWEELLQLLPLGRYWEHDGLTFRFMLPNVAVACSVAQGRPAAMDQLVLSGNLEQDCSLTAQHRQRMLNYYASHPDHIALFKVLGFMAWNVLPDVAAVAKQLWQGLRSTLQVRQLPPQLHQPDSDCLVAMLDQLCGLIARCLAAPAGQDPATPDLAACQAFRHAEPVVSHWVQQGILADLQQAADLGSREAVKVLIRLPAHSGSAQAARQVLVDFLQQRPTGVAASLARELAAAADMLDRPGPLPGDPDASSTAGAALDILLAIRLCPDGQSLLAGPLGTPIRRLARHFGNAALAALAAGAAAEPNVAMVACVMVAVAACAADLCGQMDGSALQEPAMLEVSRRLDDNSILETVEQEARGRLASLARQQRKLHGRGCDQCGKLGAEVEQQGGKLRRCMGCLQVWYCGAECQKKAWGAGHRAECKAAQNEAAAAVSAAAGSSKGAQK